MISRTSGLSPHRPILRRTAADEDTMFDRRPRVLVTGASRGIGAAIARALAARNCRVAIHCNNRNDLAEGVRAGLPGQGHLVIASDLATESGVDEVWRESLTSFGSIDILVNNAGVFTEHPPLTTSTESWRKAWRATLAANLLGPAHLSHLAAQSMAAAGGGRIVNISSRGAFRGEPDAPAYGASKAGLNALSQSLAKALAPHRVTVFCIAPGWVETDMAATHLRGESGRELLAQHPLGRVATAEEVARTAVFCALDAPEAMTGSVLDVNGASYLRT